MSKDEKKVSLCFTCKHGISIEQILETEVIPIRKKDEPVDPEPWQEGNDEADKSDHDHALIKDNGCFNLCFWPVTTKKGGPISLGGIVTSCSRYEKNKGPSKKS